MNVLIRLFILSSVFLLGVTFSEPVRDFGHYMFVGGMGSQAVVASDIESDTRYSAKHSLTESDHSNRQVLASKNVRNSREQSQEQLGQSFSWSEINRLINTRQFDKAVELLKAFLDKNSDSAQAWGALAGIYEKQNRKQLALEAWFNFVEYESDVNRLDPILDRLTQYFSEVIGINGPISDIDWTLEKLQLLTEFRANDGELHWMLASLFLGQEDTYQAQYHALMAATDPVVQERAEKILAELNGESIPDNLSIPLVRFGNQYLVNINVEGQSAALLLDTGASISGLSQSFVNRYSFLVKDTKPITLNTASGVENSFLFRVDHLGIESLSFNDHILAILPMSSDTKFDGLLGVDILGRFDFVIDQDALMLRLTPRS